MAKGLSIDPADLVSRIRGGDRSAETELVECCHKTLRFILRMRYDDEEFVNDVLQDTFIAVIENLRSDRIEFPERLSAYVRRIALNTAFDVLRKIRRQIPTDPVNFESHTSDHDLLADLEKNELASMARQVLDELEQKRDRDLLLHFYYYDIDKNVLCKRFEVKPEHFDRINSRARKRLKALLEKRLRRKIPLSVVNMLLTAFLTRQGGPAK
ncbi:MAG: sigma-70 family RNA polymerase sigma factor [Xanthomonadales bacterium]|nr:sigma-70 family RNA polymerase sigma factor [Xanthomonadales bacterium]